MGKLTFVSTAEYREHDRGQVCQKVVFLGFLLLTWTVCEMMWFRLGENPSRDYYLNLFQRPVTCEEYHKSCDAFSIREVDF